MRLGVVTMSKELKDGEEYPMLIDLIGKELRSEVSMVYANTYDVLIESDHFKDILDGTLIPRYDIEVSTYNGEMKVSKVTEL